MHLTLTLPGLLLPPEIRTDTLFDLHAPALSRLIGRAKRKEISRDWLCDAFGLPAPLPVAALRRQGTETGKVDTADTLPGGYLCLDPVHLRVSREGITLADPAELKPDADEAAALIACITPLFAPWGELAASSPGSWELALTRPVHLETIPLPDAIGLPVAHSLPGGENGREWRILMAEAQTLLHAHPVNRKRDALGLPLINSLWCWGGGTLPDQRATRFDCIFGDTPLHTGLARWSGIQLTPPASEFKSGFVKSINYPLMSDERLFSPARTLDAITWRNRLLELEHDWFIPLLSALSENRCQEARLIATGFTDSAVEFHITRNRLWHFWRRDCPLTELQ